MNAETTRRAGTRGEDAACSYLSEHGCRILARNYYAEHCELDIVADDGERILIVEVKARTANDAHLSKYGSPAAAVTKQKQERILRAARAYLREHPADKPIRLDVIEVLWEKDGAPPHIHHRKAAFTA